MSGFEEVEFESQGALLRGRAYRPDGRERFPVIVMAHGFSATITIAVNRYAEAFQRAGLGVVLYDHRNFGASAGEPRCQMNPWLQARGYSDAVSFATTLAGADPERIALWGDSASGAVALVAAAVDDRVAALVVQCPATGSDPAPADPAGSLYVALADSLAHGAIVNGPGNTAGPPPVVSHNPLAEPSWLPPVTAFRWFIEYGGRFGSAWVNQATVFIPDTPAPFHAGIAAPHIRCPVLMQISPDDEIEDANPDVSCAVHAAILSFARLVEIDGGHFGVLHYPGSVFSAVSSASGTSCTTSWGEPPSAALRSASRGGQTDIPRSESQRIGWDSAAASTCGRSAYGPMVGESSCVRRSMERT